MCTTIRVETQEKRRKERRWMDGGDEHEEEKKRVKEGPLHPGMRSLHPTFWTLFYFVLTVAFPNICFYACFKDEEPEAYSH